MEDNFCRLRIHNSSGFRNKLFPLICDIKKFDGRSETDTNTISAFLTTRKFMANNPNIFTKADKGNTVVALNRLEYIAKMENIFSDTNTYILQRNPINKLINELKKTLKRWIQSKFISDKEFSLNSSSTILPRAYGLPKI